MNKIRASIAFQKKSSNGQKLFSCVSMLMIIYRQSLEEKRSFVKENDSR